ncbi:unnamed protein product [Spirodela intermedia]|uniref:Uncharacterized protein n=1 Tax=Spirodela intermedia TaxID=51605 RepID=A0A7I8JQZ9_SPIIN|nr:unnamed protein product [Spirodela intermedia]CAA6672191.1 unnamed protein product [Spirodela intermedia]
MAAWQILAVLVASLSTLLYVILQFFHSFLSCAPKPFFLVSLVKLFVHTSKNVRIRSSQLLYWSFFLQGAGSSSTANVEYAHRAALRKHAVWSSIAIDLLLGNVLGLLLLVHQEAYACGYPGLPAASLTIFCGFKLNTELAELFGLVSLNAIQIWSTLWFYMGFLFRSTLTGLAFSGMLLGATIPAALCIDLLKLATLHVTVLHRFISFLYSQQIWALTSLWRLFRGQKWNPLRLRLDSFDYSVEQHVVGSLLFTPILLLLPTTSVFYIFFTIVNSSISLLCITLEVGIAVLHATPYAEVPSGLWLHLETLNHRQEEEEDDSIEQLVSSLRSNYAKMGQILGPRYRSIFRGVSLSTGSSSIYGVLSGQRVPSTLGVGLPVAMPWTNVRSGVYWRLCRSSVLACGPGQRSEL